MSARSKFIAVCLLPICFAVPTVSHATGCGGTNINNLVTWDTNEISKGTKVTTYRGTSVIMSDDTKAPFHLAAGECLGSYITFPDGKMRAVGTCARKDKDGDVLIEDWEASGNKGTSKFAGGTGKFATASGTSQWENTPLQGKMGAVRWTGDCR